MRERERELRVSLGVLQMQAYLISSSSMLTCAGSIDQSVDSERQTDTETDQKNYIKKKGEKKKKKGDYSNTTGM